MKNDNSELIEFLDEKFLRLDEKFQVINNRFEQLEIKFDDLQKSVAQLPTKSYLDDKLANLEGGLITKLRKEDEKLNRLTELLKQKKILTEGDVTELQNLQVFPK